MPVSWLEQIPDPACLCGHAFSQHVLGYSAPERRMECTETGPFECPCGHYVSEDDICEACNGAGILGDVRRSSYDGRRCNACAGQGYIESSSVAGEPA